MPTLHARMLLSGLLDIQLHDPEQDNRMTPETSVPDLLSNIGEDSGSKEDQGMENNDPSDKDENMSKVYLC